jgi:iron complex outermembrane receptor protein
METILRIALAGTTAIGWVAPALAQESIGSTSNDIVVTARRVAERLQDVPISITVFNQQNLTNRNVVSASDLAIYTPSLSSNNRFGADKSSFTLRGFSQDGKTEPTVALYVRPQNQVPLRWMTLVI